MKPFLSFICALTLLTGCTHAPAAAVAALASGSLTASATDASGLLKAYGAVTGNDAGAMAKRAQLLQAIAQTDDPRAPAFLQGAYQALAARPDAAAIANALVPAAPPEAVTPATAGGDPDTMLGETEAIAVHILSNNTRAVRVKGLETPCEVLQAGHDHFGALWARDASFAFLGALAYGQTDVVHDSLDVLLRMQRADGLIPRRLGHGTNNWGLVLAALGIHVSTDGAFDTADYKSGMGLAPVDTNPLIVWLTERYVAKTNDTAFWTAHRAGLERAMTWLLAKRQNGLVVQGPFEDWKDLTARAGKVLYTNVLTYQALESMANLYDRAGDTDAAQRARADADGLAAAIQSAFWDPARGYFHDTDTLDQFSADGNFLAIAFGIATPAQGKQILDLADQKLRKPWGWYGSIDKPYPNKLVPFYLSLFGMKGYGDDTMNMSLITSMYALAATRLGDTARAKEALLSVARSTMHDGTFEEVYDAGAPVPVSRRFYRSERDFTWSAGLYLAALSGVRAAR